MNVRVIFLLVAAIFIAAVVVSSLRHRRRIKFQRKFMEKNIQENGGDLLKMRSPGSFEKDSIFDGTAPIAFFIMARSQHHFSGVDLVQSLLDVGLHHEKNGIFVYSDDSGAPLFRILSAQEPGNFDLAQIELLMVPGLCVVLNSDHTDLVYAFNMMMNVSNEIADRLDAIILDSNKQPCQQAFLEQCRLELLERSRQRTESLVTF